MGEIHDFLVDLPGGRVRVAIRDTEKRGLGEYRRQFQTAVTVACKCSACDALQALHLPQGDAGTYFIIRKHGSRYVLWIRFHECVCALAYSLGSQRRLCDSSQTLGCEINARTIVNPHTPVEMVSVLACENRLQRDIARVALLTHGILAGKRNFVPALGCK